MKTTQIKCPRCSRAHAPEEIWQWVASLRGSVASEAKAKAARLNGKKGGRPRTSGESTKTKDNGKVKIWNM